MNDASRIIAGMRWGAFLVILAAATTGCGGDDGGGGNSCEDVNQLVCDLACDCTAGDECAIDSGGAVTITHDNPADCSGFWVTFGCSQSGADDVDYAACRTALESAGCVDTGEGMALEFPPECGDAE